MDINKIIRVEAEINELKTIDIIIQKRIRTKIKRKKELLTTTIKPKQLNI